MSGAPLTTLENRGERIILLPNRTHNRSRSPRLAASCDWNNVGKGSRQNRSVTSGKGLALRVELAMSSVGFLFAHWVSVVDFVVERLGN